MHSLTTTVFAPLIHADQTNALPGVAVGDTDGAPVVETPVSVMVSSWQEFAAMAVKAEFRPAATPR